MANSEVFCRSADEGMDARKLDVVSLLLFGSKTSQDGGMQAESSKKRLNDECASRDEPVYEQQKISIDTLVIVYKGQHSV